MFERYTEKARRVIFFARYEASQFGSPNIETEHMLLGLLREDKALTNRFLDDHATVEAVRKEIESNTPIREHVSTSTDLPLSNECKRVLAFAAEEAERLQHRHIGTEHLLLGLLSEDKSFAAALLNKRGLRLAEVREALEKSGVPTQITHDVVTTEVAEQIPQLLQIIDQTTGKVIASAATWHAPAVGNIVSIRDPKTNARTSYPVTGVHYVFEPVDQADPVTHAIEQIIVTVRA